MLTQKDTIEKNIWQKNTHILFQDCFRFYFVKKIAFFCGKINTFSKYFHSTVVQCMYTDVMRRSSDAFMIEQSTIKQCPYWSLVVWNLYDPMTCSMRYTHNLPLKIPHT